MLPLVVIVHRPDGQTQRFAFAESPVRIGRSPLNDLQLTDGFVSRWEGVLRFNEKEITYFNVGTTNPTLSDGRAAEASEEIVVGPATELTVGELRLRFAREAVPEKDVRRKGKRRPQKLGEEADAKTVWLGADKLARIAAAAGYTPVPSVPETLKPPPQHAEVQLRATENALPPQTGRPAQSVPPAPPGAVRMGVVQRVGPATSPPASVTAPPVSAPATTDASALNPPSYDGPYTPRSLPGETSGHFGDAALDTLHDHYRDAWHALHTLLVQRLEDAPAEQRVELAEKIQRRYPQVVREQEFRKLLRRLGLEPRKSEIPEIAEWLRSIAEGVLPGNFRLETGMTLERILALVEMLAQSFAEINDAQDSVRRRWLGRSSRSSLLKSDNARVILAYLLNPRANWDERLGEFEESIRDVITHEWALFKATLEGTKALLESVSPQVLAEQEGVAWEPGDDESGGKAGFWNKLRPRDASPEERLWRRFVSTYQGLMDGDRYQRTFVGRQFARTYLNAMGQGEGK